MFMAGGSGGWFLTEKPTASTPYIIHIIFITLTNLHNSNTDVGRAGFGLAPRH